MEKNEAYGISRKQLQDWILADKCHYDCFPRNKKRELFDLCICEKEGYRVATYSIKTKRIILTCPHWHIPNQELLEHFIEKCEKINKKFS